MAVKIMRLDVDAVFVEKVKRQVQSVAQVME